MALIQLPAQTIRAITTTVPSRVFENTRDVDGFLPQEVESVVKMVGVKRRRLADEGTCASDLCVAAARDVLDGLGWEPGSVDALIFVSQSPDYLLPSTSCVIHGRLGMSDRCAALDVGLGCSGYAYGLWLATLMLQGGGVGRVLVLHGETPSRFCDPGDRSVWLLFGDAGSATALELRDPATAVGAPPWWFSLHTDGSGSHDLVIEAGGFRQRFSDDPRKHFLSMNGPNIMNFTMRRLPTLIEETLAAAGMTPDAIDYFILHQSNRFIMRHIAKKCGVPPEKMPLTLEDFGNTSGPSVPLTITQGGLDRPTDRALSLLLLAYGVGLSWGSALIQLPPDARLNHTVLDPAATP